VAKTGANDKAMSYFSSCLKVLNLTDEVALTEESLKASYKKAATKAHPDKGGNEETFEAVTRSSAYLSDNLKRIKGGRDKEGVVEAPERLTQGRTEDAKSFQHVEPVRLNAKNLNMDAFNKMFEQTRMPDPEGEGYGDWLKDSAGAESGPKFSGKFNRDVFHQMFEEEVKKSNRGRGDNTNNHQMAVMSTQPMILAPTMGVELGRDRPADFTAPYSANLQFTDLRNAYTSESTFSGQVADVRVENRTFDQYQTEYKTAPKALRDHEMEAVQAFERQTDIREKNRQLRAAQQDADASDFFERMKRLVITEK
jgi:curved DNA-binding protein CbpA